MLASATACGSSGPVRCGGVGTSKLGPLGRPPARCRTQVLACFVTRRRLTRRPCCHRDRASAPRSFPRECGRNRDADGATAWNHHGVTREQLPAGWPGFRRALCLGCRGRVVAARDALITLVGTRDGSWVSAFPIEPYLSYADPLPPPIDLFVLGVAHRACQERAVHALRLGLVTLDEDLPSVAIDHPEEHDPDLPDRAGLARPPRTDRCAFCEDSSGSEEHIFGRWVSRFLGGGFVATSEFGERPSKTIPLTTNRVCEVCNNTWLSVLENDSKVVLAGLMLGNAVQLGEAEQRQVSTWAYKTALMLDLAGSGVIPLGYHRRFEMERIVPVHALVWIGGYVGGKAVSASVRPLGRNKCDESIPIAVLTTFSVGRLLVQVFHHFTAGGVTIDDQRVGATYLDQIWPSQAAFEWPRRRVGFNDEDMADLIDGVNELV